MKNMTNRLLKWPNPILKLRETNFSLQVQNSFNDSWGRKRNATFGIKGGREREERDIEERKVREDLQAALLFAIGRHLSFIPILFSRLKVKTLLFQSSLVNVALRVVRRTRASSDFNEPLIFRARASTCIVLCGCVFADLFLSDPIAKRVVSFLPLARFISSSYTLRFSRRFSSSYRTLPTVTFRPNIVESSKVKASKEIFVSVCHVSRASAEFVDLAWLNGSLNQVSL